MKKFNLSDFLGRDGLNIQRKDGLILFDYSKEIQYSFDWDEITLSARGIVFEESSGKIVAKGFDKFFNYEELIGDDGIRLPEKYRPNFSGPSMILEKADGCFHFHTPIMLPDGSYERIGKIISNSDITHVMGYDHKLNKFVKTKILNKFKNGKKDNWVKLVTSHNWSSKSGGRGLTNVMRVTDNHKFYTKHGYIPVSDINIGDVIYSYQPKFNDIQTQFIIGTLLGDSSISYNGNSSAVLQGCHKQEHAEYVILKQHMMGNLCSNTENIQSSGFGSIVHRYSSKYLQCLRSTRSKWYINGTKQVPDDIELSDLSFAFWYMDDGSINYRNKETNKYPSIRLHTNGFTYESCLILKNALHKLFGDIPITISNQKGWTICINNGYNNANLTSIIWQRIAKFFPICMQYKLPVEYRTGHESVLLSENFISNEILSEEFVTDISYEIKNDSKLNNSRQAYDIETETHNYIAHGILVHNSCGIVYYYKGEWRVNTRGSFASEQAIWAKEYLDKNIRTELMNPNWTYLFEIIYPDNRIVVDYGNLETLRLTGIIITETGEELWIDKLRKESKKIGCDIVEAFEFSSLEEMLESRKGLTVNEEGYVITYKNGYKFKLKGEMYCKVHKALCSLTPLNFWRAIDYENTMRVPQEFLELMPEEFRSTVDALCKVTEDLHMNMYKSICDLAETVPLFENSKEGKKQRFIWVSENIPKQHVNHVLGIISARELSNGKDWKVRESIHRLLRPTSNNFKGIEMDPRLKRILEEA